MGVDNGCVWGSLSFLGLLGVLSSHFLISANFNTPRGVPLSRAALYDPQKDFMCLDGSKLIPFSFVNDDYCDCPDGSDEPGTAACNNGQFFCVNAGHVSSFLQSSRVNDGICDCCDGSDESMESSCANTCNELGRAAREEAERSARLIKDGYQKRLEMSAEGKSRRQAKEEERSRLEAELKQAEAKKTSKETVKNEAEAPEKEALAEYQRVEDERKKREDEEEKGRVEVEAIEMFELLDSNSDGVIGVAEIQARSTFDRDKDGVVSEEEASFFLNLEQEMSRDEFLKSGWILAKPYFLMERGMFTPPSQTQPPEVAEETEGITERPEEEEDQDDHAHDDFDDEEEEEEQKLEVGKDNVVPESDKPKYDERTMELIRAADIARSEFQEADKVFRDVSHKLQEVNDILNLDFGDDERFSPLHGHCFDYEDREYVYTLCPFKDSNQRGKNGGGVVSLGRWGSWSGGEENKYGQMLYDKGQSCWNGPARSARVLLSCGLENRVLSVVEPSRCEYQFEFSTPTACHNPQSNKRLHEEL